MRFKMFKREERRGGDEVRQEKIKKGQKKMKPGTVLV